jgi:PAS domain S-box-containing protein
MSKLKILHLEDSAADADIVNHALKRSGLDFTVKVVAERADFENALSEFGPDVVISDHSLHQFDSSEALRIFKSRKLNIPFILVTGTVSEEFAVNILKNGADDYLLKDKLTRLPHALRSAIREKAAEREKEIANESLRILFRNIGEVFFTIDPAHGKFIQISDACLAVYGRPPAEFLENPSLWTNLIHSEDHAAKEILMSADGRAVELEYRIIHSDTSVRWIHTRLVPTRDESGSTVRIDGVSKDITARKKAKLALAAKVNELKTLIYRLYHDLRGPLTSTAGLINLAKVEIKEPGALRYLSMIEASNNRLDKILMGIAELVNLDLSNVKKSKVNFRKLINDIIATYSSTEEGKGIEFLVEVPPGEDILHHERLLYSILDNLIGNAIFFRRREKPFVRIEIRNSEGELEITVEDNGIGIDPQYHDRIFDMFFRANENSKGSGLGLYIVKHIVHSLGGEIRFTSKRGEGSRFSVIIPLVTTSENGTN